MSIENTPVEVTEDLDAFSAELFGQIQPTDAEATAEEAPTSVTDAPLEDTQIDPEKEEDFVPEDDAEVVPEEKPKTRFQQRIDELTGGKREAERRAEALEAKLNEVLEKLEQDKQTPATPVVSGGEPTPTELNEDGTDKYPLGEFDPNYIRDITKFTIQQEREAIREQDRIEQERIQTEAAKSERQSQWDGKLGPAQERYPDFINKSSELIESLNDIPAAYGEYLTETIMSMEFGPDVLYYLSTHPTEARQIVDSGAQRATIALGRIEARFALSEEEKQTRPRVSNAPTPPPTNKGAAPARIEVPDDTDDLDAFASKLFKKK